MMAVAINNSGGNLQIGTPKALFDSKIVGTTIRNFDVAKDGRFLIPMQEHATTAPLTLVVNWQAALNK